MEKFPTAEFENDISRNCLVGNRKKIAKFLMRTFTCHSTFLYALKSLYKEEKALIIFQICYKNNNDYISKIIRMVRKYM